MLSRRSVLTVILSLPLVCSGVYAAPIGMRAPPSLLGMLAAMGGIDEGAGPLLYILVSPSCSKAAEMWEVTRGLSAAMNLRWVPCWFSEDERHKVAACLAGGDSESVRRMLLQEPPGVIPKEAHYADASRQARLYEGGIAKMLWETTGKTPTMPTMVAAMRDGSARVVRGAIPADRAADLLDLYY